MNHLAVFVGLFVALVFDASLGHVLAVGPFAPSATMVFVVFLALHAPRSTVPWLGWLGGMLVDLLTDLPHAGWGPAPLIGPNALGWCLGSYLIVLVRSMLFKRQLHTVAVMTLLFGVTANLGAVFVLSMHALYEPGAPLWAEGGATAELLRRCAAAAASGVLGLVVGPLLTLALPLWAFRSPLPRAIARSA